MTSSQLVKQLKLITDYNRALQIQNQTRNQQRQHLQTQINRLLKLIAENRYSENFKQCPNCEKYIIKIKELQEKVQRIIREKDMLENSYNILSKKAQSSQQNKSLNKKVAFIDASSPTSSTKSSYELNSLKIKYQNSERQINVFKNNQKILRQQKIKLQQAIIFLENKISRINSQLFNLKSSLENKQNQISELERKLSSLNSELFQAKKQNQIKQNQINRLKIDNLPPRKTTVISHPQYNKNEEVDKLKIELSTCKLKYQSILNQNYELKKKSTALLKYEYQINKKNQEIVELKAKIESYQRKINQVSQQLEKYINSPPSQPIQNTFVSNYRQNNLINQFDIQKSMKSSNTENINLSIDGEKIYLRGQVNRLNSINQSISTQIINIKKQQFFYIERIKDLERRIQVLQETNQSLRKQLSISIQKRKSPIPNFQQNNSINAQNNFGFVSNIYDSVNQNQPNSLQKNQKQDQNAMIFKSGSFGLKNISTNNNKERFHTDPIQNNKQKQSPIYNTNNQKWKDLQSRIQRLKSQNSELKKTLYILNDN